MYDKDFEGGLFIKIDRCLPSSITYSESCPALHLLVQSHASPKNDGIFEYFSELQSSPTSDILKV